MLHQVTIAAQQQMALATLLALPAVHLPGDVASAQPQSQSQDGVTWQAWQALLAMHGGVIPGAVQPAGQPGVAPLPPGSSHSA